MTIDRDELTISRLVGHCPKPVSSPMAKVSGARRDLELVLFGIALVRSERGRVLEGVDGLGGEIGSLLVALRDQDRAPIERWAGDRGLALDGNDIIASIIAKIQSWMERERLQRICQEVSFSAQVEDTEEIKKRLLEVLKQIEGEQDGV